MFSNIDGALIIAGLAVVFAVLLLFWRFTALKGKQMDAVTGGQGSKQETAIAAQGQPAALAVEQEVSDDVVAAITAAIVAMTGSTGFVVKSIRRADRARSAWALAGIQQNTQSF